MSSSTRRAKGPIILPLLLISGGVLLLLNNFLIVQNFNLAHLLPLAFVVIGGQILLRGDWLPGSDFRTFGITRGSVESALLEIDAGEIDVSLQALQGRSQERLIAGQYAANARPELLVAGTHAQLRLDRARTPWFSFADWDLGLTSGLPWELIISTSTGVVNLDMTGLVVQKTAVYTGAGEIRLMAPQELFETIVLRSTLGNIHIIAAADTHTKITVQGGRLLTTHVDFARYTETAPGMYETLSSDTTVPSVTIQVSGGTGDVYLA
jgi:hypothetical protein